MTDRQKIILKAIIELYAKDGIPVGSKNLTSVPYLNFSPATIRFDMQELEERGYLEKTHQSSGRIPSKKGYHYYIENLVTRDVMIAQKYHLFDEVLNFHQSSLEKATDEALKLLSEITNYTAVAISPNTSLEVVQKIDLIQTGIKKAVILIVTDKGNVIHNTINLSDEINYDKVQSIIKNLSETFIGYTIKEVKEILSEQIRNSDVVNLMNYQDAVINSFISAFDEFSKDKFYLTGISNIAAKPDLFSGEAIKSILEIFDKKDILNVIKQNEKLSIKFGNDMQLTSLDQYTMLSIPYKINENETGVIAVMGPRRMEYQRVIPLLEYLSAHLGKLYRK